MLVTSVEEFTSNAYYEPIGASWVGESMPIIYDPEDPNIALIDTFQEPLARTHCQLSTMMVFEIFFSCAVSYPCEPVVSPL
ncbi:MAG: hypothetical protein ABIU06_04685 [Anaerolineales bacterium]